MNNNNIIPDEVNLGLAGIAVTLRAAHPGFRLTLEPALWPFRSNLEPEVVLRLHNEPAPIPDLGPALFGSGKNWSLHAWQKKTVLRVRAVGSAPDRPYYIMVLEPDGLQGDIYYENTAGDGHPSPVPVLERPLDEVLAVHLLAQQQGLLLHASAVSLDGHGLLFAGTSGSGKSTLLKQWKSLQGVTLLGDERISLRRRGERFWLYGTHWHSSAGVASPEAAPLEAIFILKHAADNQATPLKPSVSTTSLLVRSFPPLWDADGMAFTLQFLGELLQAVPCYELCFKPDASAVEYVRWLVSS